MTPTTTLTIKMEPTKTTLTTLEDIRFYDDAKKTDIVARRRRRRDGILVQDDDDDDDDDVDDEAYRRALDGVAVFVFGVGKMAQLEKRVQKAKTERLLPLETRELVDALREEGSADAVLTDNRDEDEKMVHAVFEKSNPTVAGEMFAMNEIFREKRRDKGGGFDANAAAEKEEGGGILSRKTMEFWEAVVSRIEFEYEKEMKKTMDSSQIERLDAVGYKIEAAAKRIRAQYNNFLSRYVYALDAKWKDDKENRSRSEAIGNLKLRVLLLKDAVMKRREREASRIFSKKFALEAKHLLVDLKMPSPEAVTLYQFLLTNVESRDEI